MKRIEAPRTWAVYTGFEFVLRLVLGAIDFANNRASYRPVAYAVLEAEQPLLCGGPADPGDISAATGC